MRQFPEIPLLATRVLRLLLILALGMLAPLSTSGQSTIPSQDLFTGNVPFRAIGYDLPDGAWPNTLPPLCALSRDLPLIAETGATVVYTRGHPPEDGDHIFLSLLASTRLSWVAAFPLPDDLDPAKSLLEQKPRVLASFSAFAERYRGNRNLRAVTLDFNKQQLAEAALLTADFAMILQREFPTNRPRLGYVAYTPSRLDAAPPGLDFWVYRFEGSIPTNSTRLQLIQRTALPIVFDLAAVSKELLPPEAPNNPSPLAPPWRDYLALFRGSDSRQPLLTLNFLGTKEVASSTTTAANNGASTTTVSYRYRKDGLFVCIRDSALFEQLEPTPLMGQQRADWGAAGMETHAAAPVVEQVKNAAAMNDQLAPGTQIRVQGRLFQMKAEEEIQEGWPLHARARSICVAGRPVPVRAMASQEALAQLPWLLAGDRSELRLVREGITSAPVTIRLGSHAPGIFGNRLVRSGGGPAGCTVSIANGLKPGETLELHVTGTGALNGTTGDLKISLDGAVMPVLEAGLVSDEPGVARILARVPEAGAATGEPAGLYLRQGQLVSNLVPVSFAGKARPTVGLVASAAGLQVQPGGVSAPLRIQTEGLNGFCGPVDFEVLGLPPGVTASIARVEAGKEASLVLRADGTAMPSGKFPFYLYALPVGGDLNLITLEVTVLERATSVVLNLESAGYSAGSQATIRWAGTTLSGTGVTPMRGLFLLVVNPASGLTSAVERYDIYDSASESLRLEARLAAVPAGTIVGMAVADDATLGMQNSLRTLIQTKFGSTAIAGLGYQHSWALIGKAGAAPLAEASDPKLKATAQATLQFPPR